MYYFTYGDDFAIVEDAKQADKFEAAGWQKATREQVIAAWRRRDQVSRPGPPVQRVVGENVVYPVGHIH